MGKEHLQSQKENGSISQVEDRVMKTAAQFFGEDLLTYTQVKGKVGQVAPTEHIHLEMRRMEEDFNFIMKDGSWRHLEFESDSITERDLRRFREYEAYISMVHNVPVATTVLCTSNVKVLKSHLVNGENIYRVELVRLKDRNADQEFEKLEQRLKKGKKLKRHHVFPILLSPLMSGDMKMQDRICRGMEVLQSSKLNMEEDDIKKMQSVLYALAVKFLKKDELEQVKEKIGMTMLGQMIWDMGLEKGLEKGMETGMETGIQALILDNLEEGIGKERIIKKLTLRFSLEESEALAFYEKYSTDALTAQGR